MDHEAYMRAAIAEAEKNPAAPFGTVIVDTATGEIVARGVNRMHENPILHGEIVALNECAARRVARPWKGLALYTTAEPCPMCAAACVWSGIGTIAYGVDIPWLAQSGWYQIDLRASELFALAGQGAPELIEHVLESSCQGIFPQVRSNGA